MFLIYPSSIVGDEHDTLSKNPHRNCLATELANKRKTTWNASLKEGAGEGHDALCPNLAHRKWRVT